MDSHGFVHIEGNISNGLIADATHIFTLPEVYRPPDAVSILATKASDNEIAYLQIANDGIVKIYGAVNTGAYRICGTFQVRR